MKATRGVRAASRSTVPNNLPRYLTTFVGRGAELAALKPRLARARLLTLTGAGGVGKSRLAAELARASLNRWPGGAWWVGLASIRDPGQVPAATAAAIGLPPHRHPLEVVGSWLEARRALLILDNCEHLLGACAELCEHALQRCSELTILVTSREPLCVPAETNWSVKSLPTSDSLELFELRGRRILPDFELTSANRDVVSAICRHLDGLPLAVELAAAQLMVMSEREILDGLNYRFHLLKTGSRATPERQQALISTIDWSYRLLSPVAAALFRRLAVFRGGFTREAAEAICADGLGAPLLELLADLVRKSLVEVQRMEGASRYQLLESLRAYAQDKLVESGELPSVTRRHFEFYSDGLAARTVDLVMDRRWPLTPETETWKRVERDNLQAALEWAANNADDMGLCLAVNFSWIEETPQMKNVLIDLIDRSQVGGIPRAAAMRRAAGIATLQGDHGAAISLAEAAIDLGRELGDPQELAYTLMKLGQIHHSRGELDAAGQALGEAESLIAPTGNRILSCMIRACIADLAIERGEFTAARDILVDTVTTNKAAGRYVMAALDLNSLGSVQLGLDEDHAAAASFAESLSIVREFNHRLCVLCDFAGLAQVAARLGQNERALQLGAALDRFSREWFYGIDASIAGQLADSLARARERLGPNRSKAAWQEGSIRSLDGAIRYALGENGEAEHANGPLTGRQKEVAVLIARGLRNWEIADRLHISPRTVDAHVDHIRNKLGHQSRAQVAWWATEQGLVNN